MNRLPVMSTKDLTTLCNTYKLLEEALTTLAFRTYADLIQRGIIPDKNFTSIQYAKFDGFMVDLDGVGFMTQVSGQTIIVTMEELNQFLA